MGAASTKGCEGPNVAVAAAAAAAAPGDASFATLNLRVGFAVKIHGLVKASELNGQSGICKEWLPQMGRWHVALAGGGFKFVKPDNLTPDLARSFVSFTEASTTSVASIIAPHPVSGLKDRRNKVNLSVQTMPILTGNFRDFRSPGGRSLSKESTASSSLGLIVEEDEAFHEEEEEIVQVINIEGSESSRCSSPNLQ